MISFINVSEKRSLFQFIDEYWLSSVGAVEANDRAFHRICSLMRKMGVKTAIVENIEPDSTIIKKEKEALNRYFDHDVTMKIFRLNFSRENIENEEGLREINKNNSILANAMIVNFKENGKWHSYVFSAIVGIPKMKHKNREFYIQPSNNYIHIARNFECHIQCSDDIYAYRIYGTYFCQQNYFTSVCAHAALCMVINNQRSLKNSILEPEDLNIHLGINHKSKKLSKDGNNDVHVSTIDITEFLDKNGFDTEIRNFFSLDGNSPSDDYSEFLYRHIESRHHCLLVFSTREEDEMHIVPIMGHTLNTDLWKPEAEIVYSNNIIRTDDIGFEHRSASAWVDHFIIHDDNFGMYYCLPIDLLRRRTTLNEDPVFRAIKAIVIKSKGLKTLASVAEKHSLEIMERNIFDIFLGVIPNIHKDRTQNYWLYMIIDSIINKKNTFVVRTLLTTKEDFQQNMNQCDYEGVSFTENEKNNIMEVLPERFWLTELTFPDLYTANGTKLVDVIYSSEIEAGNLNERWIQTRMPGVLINNSSRKYIPLSVKSHYPLFSFKETYKVYEY